jgi:spore coat polysaccharide biosynthesis protein SpsF
MNNTIAIIQARMGSDRLPGKVLLKAYNIPLLQIMVERVSNAKEIDKIVIATSVEKQDKEIVNFCKKRNIEYFCGSEKDVLGRYKKAADKFHANTVVRLTGDNPITDPVIIDKVVKKFHSDDFDFVSNFYPYPRTFPEGFSVEVFKKKILDEGYEKTQKPSDREHVTFFMWMQPEKYKIFRVDNKENVSKYRLTLDYQEDYQVIKEIIESMYPKNPLFSMSEVISWLEKNPKIKKINEAVQPNQGWKKSLEEDQSKGFKAYNFKEYVK